MILLIFTLLLAVPVACISGCRLLHITVFEYRQIWCYFYSGMGVSALFVISEALMAKATFGAAMCMVPFLLYLIGSRATWLDGPPRHMEKQ